MPSSKPTTLPRTGSARRYLAAALLCGVGAAGALSCPGTASAAGAPDARDAVSALPDVADGLQLHTSMMPADSPDAAPAAGAAGLRAAPAPGDPGPTAKVTTTTYGVDVASYQHSGGRAIDWRAVAASGSAFAIVKATESGYTNPWYSQDVAGAHSAGMIVGAYTFARPANSAIAQADKFAQVIGTLPSPSLPPVLDLEDNGGLSPSQLISWTHTFLNRLEADTGRVPMIYTGPYFWNTSMAGSTAFTRYPLWEAQYTSASAPNRMGGWPTYRLWQYSSTGSVPGIVGSVDRNRFEGSRSQLAGAASTFSPIDAKHAALGGDGGLLGPAISAENDTSAPGGRLRYYTRGAIYWSAATGAHEVHGALLDRYKALGGTSSALGLPVADEGAVPGGRSSAFQRGAMLWSVATGAHAVQGAVAGCYFALGGPAALGLPTGDEADVPGGRVSPFQAGRVYWSAGTGAHEVRGAVLAEYDVLGGPAGVLGLPVTGEGGVPAVAGARRSGFQRGQVLWSPTTGAHEVHGAISAQYDATGGPAALGLPTVDERPVLSGRRSTFARGDVYWTAATGARTVWGAIGYRYHQDGGAARYGFPVGPEQATPTGARQQFQQVTISWDSARRATAVAPR